MISIAVCTRSFILLRLLEVVEKMNSSWVKGKESDLEGQEGEM